MAILGGQIGFSRKFCSRLMVSSDVPEFLDWHCNHHSGVSSSTWWARRRMRLNKTPIELMKAELHQTDPIKIHCDITREMVGKNGMDLAWRKGEVRGCKGGRGDSKGGRGRRSAREEPLPRSIHCTRDTFLVVGGGSPEESPTSHYSKIVRRNNFFFLFLFKHKNHWIM